MARVIWGARCSLRVGEEGERGFSTFKAARAAPLVPIGKLIPTNPTASGNIILESVLLGPDVDHRAAQLLVHRVFPLPPPLSPDRGIYTYIYIYTCTYIYICI